jgi:predicted Zn-dependent protease
MSPAEQAAYDKAWKVYLAAAAALKAEQYSTAEADARQAISLGEDTAESPEVLASALMAQGKNTDAIKEFAKLAPNYTLPKVEFPYALLLLKVGQWKSALNAYNIALPQIGSQVINGADLLADNVGFSPDEPEPLELEADIHVALGFEQMNDYGVINSKFNINAYNEYRAALKCSPDSPIANLAYAQSLRSVGKADEAKTALEDVAAKFTGGIRLAAQEELGIYPQPTTAK